MRPKFGAIDTRIRGDGVEERRNYGWARRDRVARYEGTLGRDRPGALVNVSYGTCERMSRSVPGSRTAAARAALHLDANVDQRTHQISWLVTDTGGWIGSRFFTVLNGATGRSA